MVQADAALRRAETLDPKWTEPTVQRGWLAEFFANMGQDQNGGAREAPTGSGYRAAAAWLQQGIAHAERALRRRPNDPKALSLRGALRYHAWEMHLGDSTQVAAFLVDAERDLRGAVTGEPGLAPAWNMLSMVQYSKGEFTEAAITLQRALEADAYLSEAARNVQLLLFAALERGDDSAASAWCEIGRTRFPDDQRFLECQLIILGWVGSRPGDAAQAWRLLGDVERRDSAGLLAATWAIRRLMTAAVLARAGLGDSARNVMRAARDGAPNPTVLDGLELYEAYVQTLLGERDAALRLLSLYTSAYPQDKSYVARTRWFVPLRDDPRFQALAGLPPEPPRR
jgi:tetratricopeptide (TPR) repeat protein